MPAPTNISAATAIDVGALPASITQNVHDSGTTYTVWYKYTALTGDNVIGVWGYGDLAAGYQPVVTIYTDTAGTSVPGLGASRERPMQFGVTVGTTYYIQCNKGTAGNPIPAVLSLEVERFTDGTVAAGSIGVNNERLGQPAMFASRTTDYTTLRFVQGIAQGDFGAQLPDGTLALDNGNATGVAPLGEIKIYNTAMNEVATVARTINSGSMASNRDDAFYFLLSGTATPTVRKCSAAGVTIADYHPTGGFFNTMCVSPDDTILYYTTTSSAIIRRWDLATDTALSNLVTLAANPNQTEMLCLSSGSVLVIVPSIPAVLRYSAAGALEHTYSFTSSFPSGNRLAHDNNDDTTFWMRDHGDSAFNKFWQFNVATGAVVIERRHASFLFGVYGESNADITPTPLARFGVAESCPMWLTVAAFPSGSTGSVLVIKIVDPEDDPTEFAFTTDGGLTPETFSLMHGQSQAFNSVTPGSGYSVLETADPNFTTTYVVSSDEDPSDFTVVAGETTTITVTNVARNQFAVEMETRKIRWLRQSPHVSANMDRAFHNLFMLDMEVGVSLREGQGVNAKVVLQVSKDGGHTWGNARELSMGLRGEYKTLMRWWRQGYGRDFVYRIYGSDPVSVKIVGAYIGLEPGDN